MLKMFLTFLWTNITGGGFTQMHQEGQGTVDSGCTMLSGYTEVVMLRRLPECHKKKACQLIPSETTDLSLRKQQALNVLYRLPCDYGHNNKLMWPETGTVEAWEKLGYVPDSAACIVQSLRSLTLSLILAWHSGIVLLFLF
jgi:hypothetical protein